MRIENTDFNTEAIKQMPYKQFQATYKGILKDTKAAYEALTGKAVEEKEEQKQAKKTTKSEKSEK